MVQANVGQKRLKRNILRRFYFRSSLANFHLSAWCKSSIISLPYCLAPRFKYSTPSAKSFPSDWYVTPLLLLGQRQLEPFFKMKSKKQPKFDWPQHFITANTRPMVVFSGLYESPGPPPSGNARGIVPPHRDDHRNGIKVGIFCIFAVLIVALATAGAIRSE